MNPPPATLLNKARRLHILVAKGDLEGVRAHLDGDAAAATWVDARDAEGRTALMRAAGSPRAGVDVLRLLLAHGASLEPKRGGGLPAALETSVLKEALRGGDPDKVRALVEAGASVLYRGTGNYGAPHDAVFGREVRRDPRLLELLSLLLALGAQPDLRSDTYGETAVAQLSLLGRYDAVRLLLDAGADASVLSWTALLRAAALGSLAELEAALLESPSLEARDAWGRTAFHVALLAGDLAKAKCLREHEAVVEAVSEFDSPALLHAVRSGKPEIVRWLLSLGCDPEQVDDLGTSALKAAVEADQLPMVDELLRADVNPDGDPPRRA